MTGFREGVSLFLQVAKWEAKEHCKAIVAGWRRQYLTPTVTLILTEAPMHINF